MTFEIIILVSYIILGLSFSVFIFYYEIIESVKNKEDFDSIYQLLRAITLGVTIWPILAIIGAIYLFVELVGFYKMQNPNRDSKLDLPPEDKKEDE